MRKYKEIAGEYAKYLATCRRNGQASFTITFFGNGCSEEPLAPTVVPLVVANFEEGLGPLEAGRIHSQRVPSSVVPHKGLVEAVQDTVAGEHRYSVALDVSGGGGCGIAEAIRS